jgi:hypothetical protein
MPQVGSRCAIRYLKATGRHSAGTSLSCIYCRRKSSTMRCSQLSLRSGFESNNHAVSDCPSVTSFNRTGLNHGTTIKNIMQRPNQEKCHQRQHRSLRTTLSLYSPCRHRKPVHRSYSRLLTTIFLKRIAERYTHLSNPILAPYSPTTRSRSRNANIESPLASLVCVVISYYAFYPLY